MRCQLLTILFFCCLITARAQVDNTALEQRSVNEEAVDSLSAGQQKLSLDVLSFNYFRNYEYFNQFADGLTYFGMQLRPQLVFTVNKHLSLYGGIMLSKDFGRHDFRDVEPVLGIRYEKNGISFINGAIDPHLSHRYVEPLFNYDRSITDPVEYGTQLKFDRPRHRSDIWISWENMIYRRSAEQEQILGGVSSELYLIRDEHRTLSIPLQVLGWHQGGQIDTTSLPVLTELNGAAGISYERLWEGAVEKLFTKNYLLGYSSSSDQSPYERGAAFYLNAGLETRWLDAMLSYWQGHRFVAPVGAPVFQSVSSHLDHLGLKQDDRRLLFLRLKKDFTLADQLLVSARLEPFWDFDGEYADYSMSLYLVYQGFFDLFRFQGK